MEEKGWSKNEISTIVSRNKLLLVSRIFRAQFGNWFPVLLQFPIRDTQNVLLKLCIYHSDCRNLFSLSTSCFTSDTPRSSAPRFLVVLALSRVSCSNTPIYCLFVHVMLRCLSVSHTRVYPKVSELTAWSESCKCYSSLPLGAVVSLFCESV
jgi:hypothetical protein